MLRTKELSGLDTRDQRTVEGPTQENVKVGLHLRWFKGHFNRIPTATLVNIRMN